MREHWRHAYEDWLQHLHTQQMLAKYEPQLRMAHADLLKVCETSMDAEVRGALVKYQGLEETIRMLKGQQKERHEDE